MSTITAGNVTVSCSLSADTTGNLVFQSGGNVTAMTIDSSQNVGIGTSSPAPGMRLAVVGGGTQISGGTSAQAGLRVQVASGVATLTGINNDNNAYNPIAFYTGASEAARIDTSGNLLVGRTAVSASERVGITFGAGNEGIRTVVASTATQFHIAFNNGSTVGAISTNGSATTYSTSSDYRLKENVQPMIGALAKVAALKPVTYKWKIDGADGEGFIAHELAEVVPDAVTGEKDAVNEDGSIKPQGIDTSFLVATLTAAIKEQQQMIEELKAEVAALKGASA